MQDGYIPEHFFVRFCRILDTLPEQLRDKNVALSIYNRSLLNYYLNALYNIYDQEDPPSALNVTAPAG